MKTPNETLQEIAEKTKWYKGLLGVSILMEITCYLIFIGFIALAFYLPDYLQLQLTIAEDEIGFYILDPEDVKFWYMGLRIALLIFSFFPLVTGILLRLMIGMKKRLREVHALAIRNGKEE